MFIAVLIVAGLLFWFSGMAGWLYLFGSAVGRIQPVSRYEGERNPELTWSQKKDVKKLELWSKFAPAWFIIVPIALVVAFCVALYKYPLNVLKACANSGEKRAASIATRKTNLKEAA